MIRGQTVFREAKWSLPPYNGTMRPLEYGEDVMVCLVGREKTFLVTLEPGGMLHSHRGTVPHDAMVGRPAGSLVQSNLGDWFMALRPRVADRMFKVRRRTQIVYPKDAGWLVMALDLKAGDRVIEMGTGSGALTILLAHFVGPRGRVYTFDQNPEHLENGLANVVRAGLGERVEGRVLSAGEPFPVSGVDAVFFDLPEPWEAVRAAREAMVPGAPLALLVPTAEQLKASFAALQDAGFARIEAVELLERRMLVRWKEGVRPSERMVGFTAYLVSARSTPPREPGAP